MPEPLKNCEYFLVEYAPYPLRETKVAIGLFLFDPDGRLVHQGFIRDWRHIRCVDPQADMALLTNLPAHFDQVVRSSTSASTATSGSANSIYEELRRMQAEQSGGVQISKPRAVLTINPRAEFDRLFQEHIEPPRRSRPQHEVREGSRQWIHARLSEALRRRSLWDRLTREVPVEEYTAPGDAFRIDFAYRPNGVTKYLHAISLERDWNHSKLLSYTFWRIREKSQAQMTAIVDDATPDLASVRSCRQILAEAKIAVQPLSLLDPFLDEVSKELRVM